MRILLRHLHRVRDHSNYVGDRNAEEEQEIGGDEEQKKQRVARAGRAPQAPRRARELEGIYWGHVE